MCADLGRLILNSVAGLAEPDLATIEELDFEFEDVCEIAKRREDFGPQGWPECPYRKAEWIGWRGCACGKGPRFTLYCDPCKSIYQMAQLMGALFTCCWCGSITNGPGSWERINKS